MTLRWSVLRPCDILTSNRSLGFADLPHMRGQSFIRERIKFASPRVALDRCVELLRVECLEPGAKSRQLLGGELFDSFLDILGGGHARDITLTRQA
jgi:hypothetical protein